MLQQACQIMDCFCLVQSGCHDQRWGSITRHVDYEWKSNQEQTFDRFKYLQYCVDKAAFPTSCSLLWRCLYVARRASWLILEHLVASPVSDITPNSPLPFLFSIGKLEPSLSTLYIIQCFASFEISSHKPFYVQKMLFLLLCPWCIFSSMFSLW